jgi:16S rRNA G966 N2-methylase RsmD
VAALGFGGVELLAMRAERLARRAPAGGGFDVAFFDPPYDVDASELGRLLGDLGVAGWFAPDALVVVERPRRTEWAWPPGLSRVRDRRYGETMLWYGRWALPQLEG